MFCLAPRDGMQVHLRPRYRYCLRWRILILLSQLLELIVSLLVGEVAVLHPAFFPAGRTHPHKPLILHPLQHLYTFAITDYASLAIDGGHAVAQDSFRGSNIGILAFIASSAASAQGGESCGKTEKHEDNNQA